MDGESPSDHRDPALEAAILALLPAVGLAARILPRWWTEGWSPGLTVRQVFDALPPQHRPPCGSLPGVAGEQRALSALRVALEALVQEGRVERGRARLRFTLNTKGSRLVEVDVYRRT